MKLYFLNLSNTHDLLNKFFFKGKKAMEYFVPLTPEFIFPLYYINNLAQGYIQALLFHISHFSDIGTYSMWNSYD